MAITVNTIYGLFFLSGDLNYIFLFPQLFAVLYINKSNSYGAIVSGVFAFLFRLSAGEPFLDFKPIIRYPWYDESVGQQFPFRTLGMILTFTVNVLVSLLAEYLFTSNIISQSFDVFKCFTDKTVTNHEKIKTIPEEHNLLKDSKV